jgi:hypothetical protein
MTSNKGNNKITELRTILQRESQNSYVSSDNEKLLQMLLVLSPINMISRLVQIYTVSKIVYVDEGFFFFYIWTDLDIKLKGDNSNNIWWWFFFYIWTNLDIILMGDNTNSIWRSFSLSELTYEFWLSLCKIVRSSVILLLPKKPSSNIITIISL